MKIYEIIDGDTSGEIGCLLYYEKCNEVIIELSEYLDEWTAPLLFTSYVKKGTFTIPRDISRLWVEERVIPSGRQNIGSLLNQHKLKEYDEMKFLEISAGRCSQDSLFIRKREKLPDYVLERQKSNLKEIFPLRERKLLAFFQNDQVKKVDLNQLEETDDLKKIQKNSSLFQSVKVGVGGYAACFNDAIDLPAAKLYEAGDAVPLTAEDFSVFLQRNIMDTSEACVKLECSRQNISYLIKQGQLNPIRQDVKGSLFLRGQLEENLW